MNSFKQWLAESEFKWPTQSIPFVGVYHYILKKYMDKPTYEYAKKGYQSIVNVMPTITKYDYFLATKGTFNAISSKEYEDLNLPIKKVKNSTTEYKYDDEYLYRKSNSWGFLSSCYWDIRTKTGLIKREYNGAAKISWDSLKRIRTVYVLMDYDYMLIKNKKHNEI